MVNVMKITKLGNILEKNSCGDEHETFLPRVFTEGLPYELRPEWEKVTVQKPIGTTFQEEGTSSAKSLKLGAHVFEKQKFGETEEWRAWGMA